MAEAQIKSALQREVQVVVPAEVVSQETDAVVAKLQRLARLPGFRRGKVPASVVRQRFAEDIKTELVEALVPRYFRMETEKQGLHPVSQPRVTDLHLLEGEPLRFTATFEVLPEVEVTGYSEIHVEKPEIAVSDEEVQQTLNQIREENATYSAIEDRPVQDGDFAQVAFRGVPRDEEGQPVSMDDVLVEIGGGNTLPAFTENLRGARAGEERSFEVRYPNDFSDTRLAGKVFDYTVTVKAVKQKHLPELNDDFARQAGSFASLDELKQKIHESLEAEKKHRSEHQAKDRIVEELLKLNHMDVPESLVDRQVDVRLERGLRALAAQGMRTEDMKKMDFGRLRAGQREAAAREVKVSLLLDKIADKENIEVSDEEIEKEIAAVARQSNQTVDAVRSRLTQDGALDRIRNRIRSEKTLDFLYSRSA
ncbi:MAG TPA: trigger factor [Terriglobales bacterium]|nr:trigger factor [Terriglobales bacterium]